MRRGEPVAGRAAAPGGVHHDQRHAREGRVQIEAPCRCSRARPAGCRGRSRAAIAVLALEVRATVQAVDEHAEPVVGHRDLGGVEVAHAGRSPGRARSRPASSPPVHRSAVDGSGPQPSCRTGRGSARAASRARAARRCRRRARTAAAGRRLVSSVLECVAKDARPQGVAAAHARGGCSRGRDRPCSAPWRRRSRSGTSQWFSILRRNALRPFWRAADLAAGARETVEAVAEAPVDPGAYAEEGVVRHV